MLLNTKLTKFRNATRVGAIEKHFAAKIEYSPLNFIPKISCSSRLNQKISLLRSFNFSDLSRKATHVGARDKHFAVKNESTP